MDRYAIIEDGTVVNVAASTRALAPNWKRSSGAKIGDSYNASTSKYTTPALVEVVPSSVTRYQLKIALIAIGKVGVLRTYIDASGEETKAYFADASEMNRDHPEIELLRVGIGITGEQVDALFRAASIIN